MSSQQEIRLFGGFHAAADNRHINELTSPRAQTLLAYLILHADTPQSRQHVAYILWSDSTESQARTNLRKVIHQLRSILPAADECLLIQRATIQWRADAPYRVDALELDALLARVDDDPHDMDALERIGDLYAGELLPSCYDDWIAPLRAGYHRRVHAALGALVQQLEERRAYEQSIHYAHRLLELDPLDETTCRRLMRLYTLNADRPAALRAYQEYADVLDRELGVEPSDETRLAYERILANTETGSLPALAHIASRRDSQLVGRTREWRILQTAWQRAQLGHAGLVSISGEAGIGKTRLAEELLDWARQQGYRAARTRSYAAHGELAYAPLAELLRQETLGSHIAGLDAVWLSEIARLLPELLTERADLPAPQPMAESWQRRRFFEAVARAVLADDAPLLLLFDDLQWSDRETLEWLTYLLHFAPQARLLALGTVRADEVDGPHPYTELEMALAHSNQFTAIALSPLDPDETQKLAVQVAGHGLPPERAERLYQDTEGNPLFVVETVRAQNAEEEGQELPAYAVTVPVEGIARLPAKVHGVIRGRLLRLSPRAHELVSLAAVVGRSFGFDVLLLSSEQDEATLADGLEELLRRRIILERGVDAYDFSHDRIRDVAYAEISRVRRRLLHDRVAQVLQQVFDADLDSISGQLAEHFVQAGRKQEAIDYLVRAGDRSADQFANREAVVYYARALSLLPDNAWEQRYALLHRRLLVYERVQDVDRLPREMDEMERVLERLDDGSQQALRRRADLANRRARFVYQAGSPFEAIRIGSQAMKWAEAADDPDTDYLARASVALAHWSVGEMQKVRDLLEEPLVRARKEGRHDIAAQLMSRLAQTGMFSGMPPGDLLNYTQQFLSIYLRTGNVEGQIDGFGKLGYLYTHAVEGDYDQARQYYGRARKTAVKTGNPTHQLLADSNEGYLYVLLGDYATADAYLERALALAESTDYVAREGAALSLILAMRSATAAISRRPWHPSSGRWKLCRRFSSRCGEPGRIANSPWSTERLTSLIWRNNMHARRSKLRADLGIRARKATR